MNNWYAIYTKPKAEDLVAGRFTMAGLKAFNPRISMHRFIGGKRHDVSESLFPCYIFAEFDPALSIRRVFYTRGVRYVLGGWQPVCVPPDIIDELNRRMQGGIIEQGLPDLANGQRVMITSGALKNFSAVFSGKANGPERVYILLDSMNCKVEIDSWMLSKRG